MMKSFRPLLAVLFLAATGASAQAQVVGFQDPLQPDCPGGVCPRPASAVQKVRDAASVGTQIILLAVSECIDNYNHNRAVRQHDRPRLLSFDGGRQGAVRVSKAVTFVPGQPVRNAGRAVRSVFR